MSALSLSPATRFSPSFVSTKSTIALRVGVAVPAKTKPKSSIPATLPPAAAIRSDQSLDEGLGARPGSGKQPHAA